MEITSRSTRLNSSFTVPIAAPSTKSITLVVYFWTSFVRMLSTESLSCLRILIRRSPWWLSQTCKRSMSRSA